MRPKELAVILVVLSVAISGFVIVSKTREDRVIGDYIGQTGSCYLDDGTCLHEDRGMLFYVAGYAISAALFLLGLYLYFDKTNEKITEHQKQVASSLEKAASKDELKAYLAGFAEDEQIVLKTINENNGIMQSTLRYKADMSKATLSVMLKSLENRKIISRKPYKKTYQVYLVKKF